MTNIYRCIFVFLFARYFTSQFWFCNCSQLFFLIYISLLFFSHYVIHFVQSEKKLNENLNLNYYYHYDQLAFLFLYLLFLCKTLEFFKSKSKLFSLVFLIPVSLCCTNYFHFIKIRKEIVGCLWKISSNLENQRHIFKI